MSMQEAGISDQPKSNFEAFTRDYPDYLLLDHEQSKRYHASEFLQRSNIVRQEIHAGQLANLSSRELYEYIYETHTKGSLLDRAVLLLDSEPKEDEPYPTLKESVKLFDQVLHSDEKGFETGSWRTSERDMVKSDGKSLTGIPAATIERVADKFFSTIDDYLKQQSKKEIVTDEDAVEYYEFSAAAAALSGLFHFKPDANGRTHQDWMVEIQRRLFKGDLSKVKAWSLSGLRARGIGNYIPQDYKEVYRHGMNLASQRAEASAYMNFQFINKFLQLVEIQDADTYTILSGLKSSENYDPVAQNQLLTTRLQQTRESITKSQYGTIQRAILLNQVNTLIKSLYTGGLDEQQRSEAYQLILNDSLMSNPNGVIAVSDNFIESIGTHETREAFGMNKLGKVLNEGRTEEYQYREFDNSVFGDFNIESELQKAKDKKAEDERRFYESLNEGARVFYEIFGQDAGIEVDVFKRLCSAVDGSCNTQQVDPEVSMFNYEDKDFRNHPVIGNFPLSSALRLIQSGLYKLVQNPKVTEFLKLTEEDNTMLLTFNSGFIRERGAEYIKSFIESSRRVLNQIGNNEDREIQELVNSSLINSFSTGVSSIKRPAIFQAMHRYLYPEKTA